MQISTVKTKVMTFQDKEPTTTNTIIKDITSLRIPVSYTHLDVYKRQYLYCVN